MYSGNPEPATDLALIINKKRAQPDLNCEIVSEASRWLKSQLHGANVKYTYLSCDKEVFAGFAMFVINAQKEGQQAILEIKIAEVDGRPHAFCQVKVQAATSYNIFPIFSDINSEEGKQLVLAFLGDFILSNEPAQA